MSKTSKEKFINTIGARLVALILSVGLLTFLVTTSEKPFTQIAGYFAGEKDIVLVQPAGQIRVREDNPALAACLERRLGDVEEMLKDGVINSHQHEQFSSRARTLCQAQNPA